METDFEINFAEDNSDGVKYFAFTGFSDKEKRELVRKVEKLKGFVLDDVTWNESCTHIISRTFEKSEVVLAGLAGGRWVLKIDYVLDSYEANSWGRARRYVHDESVLSHRKNWRRLGRAGGAFHNMKVMFVMDDVETKEVYQRIVDAGGGSWVRGDLRRARERRFDGDHLTHIIIDPWVREQRDWRYRDFEDWRLYERTVSMNSSEDGEGPGWGNGGMLFKLHYTFLMDKLLNPLDKIIENKYTIFDEKVQKMAKLRRRKKECEKLKRESASVKDNIDESSSEEDDLLVIKERYKDKERRKQPGRFYIEKHRSAKKESLCEKEARRHKQSTQNGKERRKREKSPDDLVANLGYMESSRKKNKKSGGSQIKADASRHFKVGANGQLYLDTVKLFGDYGVGPVESRQTSYINNLAQTIKDIERSGRKRIGGSQQFKEERFSYKQENNFGFKQESKYNVKQEQKGKFHNQRTFKKEIVVDLDSDSDIEEVSVVKSSRRDRIENKAAVTIVDDDIVILSNNVVSLPPGIVVLREPVDLKSEHDEDIMYLAPEVKEVDIDLEGDVDVKNVRLMEVDRDWKVEESDDDIEIIEHLDTKPDLATILRYLGPLPGIVIDSSDSDDESYDIDEIDIVPPTDLPRLLEVETLNESNTLKDLFNAVVDNDDDMEVSVDLELPIPQPSVAFSIQEVLCQNKCQLSKELPCVVDVSCQKETFPDQCQISKELPVNDIYMDTSNAKLELPVSASRTKDAKSVLPTEEISTVCQSREEFTPVPPLPITSRPLSNLFINTLNQMLLARQGITDEHISISLVCSRTPQYDKHTNKENEIKLVPVHSRVLMEFTRLREGDMVRSVKRPRIGRKVKAKIVEEVEELESESDLVKILKILDGHLSSSSYPHPEIINCIFTKYFLTQKSAYVIKQAQDLLSKFFFLHFGVKGFNRQLLMDAMLNSMRTVTDSNLFKSFDKNNTLDIRSVWTWIKSVVDKSEELDKTEVNGNEELLKVLVKIFQTDFEIWWKHERKSNKTVSLPLLYYVFGGADFTFNCQQVVPAFVRRILNPSNNIDLWYFRRLVAMTAMMNAHLDDSENQGFIHQGSKVALARVVAQEFLLIESPPVHQTELFLLQPNWFSYLVCKQMTDSKTRLKLSSLADLARMFQGLSMENNQEEEIVSEILIQKYFSFSYTHVLLRANWFFSNQDPESKQRFGTFAEMKKLAPSIIKSEQKAVKFRSCIKITVDQQLRDLKTLTKFSIGKEEMMVTENGAVNFLLFNMGREEDKGWHPGLVE